MTIYMLNKIDETHMAEILPVASSIGSVELRGYSTGDAIVLVEGSHRIEAAKRLGLPVIINLLDTQDPDAIVSGLDLDGDDYDRTMEYVMDYCGSSSDHYCSTEDFESITIR